MPTRTTFAILLLAATAAAQQSGSPLMVISQGFSIDGATILLPVPSTKTVYTTESKFDAGYPTPPPTPPGQPDFTTLPIPGTLDIDALSLGFDWVLSDAAGVVSIPPNHWGAITFSVRRTTVGAPGSVIAAEAVSPGGAAGDMFAYILPGSALPTPPTGTTFKGQDSSEIKIDSANIDAHDLFLGLIYRDNPALGALLPPPTVYFSVTAASIAATPIPPAWTGGVPALASGATVFATTWSPSTLSWTPPVVALTPAALGLTAGEDLDALALDLVHGRVLFSTDPALPPPLPTPPRDPLLYSTLGSGVHFVYRLPSGLPVRTAVGLGSAPDDIDGICALDPGDAAQPSQIRLERMLGSAGNSIFPAPTQLQAAVYRQFRQLGQDRLLTWMAGWPPPGVPTSDFAVVGISLGGPAGPWTTGALFFRPNPGSPGFNFHGHPETYQLTVPPAFSLSGIPVSFVWGAFAGSAFDLSLPVTIRL